MIRSLVLRLLAGLLVFSHALAFAGLCDCLSAPAEEARVAMSSCHEEQGGLRILLSAACCCGEDKANQRGDALAPSLSPGAGSAPASLASPAPPAAPVLPVAHLVRLTSRRGPALPRPPLRV